MHLEGIKVIENSHRVNASRSLGILFVQLDLALRLPVSMVISTLQLLASLVQLTIVFIIQSDIRLCL